MPQSFAGYQRERFPFEAFAAQFFTWYHEEVLVPPPLRLPGGIYPPAAAYVRIRPADVRRPPFAPFIAEVPGALPAVLLQQLPFQYAPYVREQARAWQPRAWLAPADVLVDPPLRLRFERSPYLRDAERARQALPWFPALGLPVVGPPVVGPGRIKASDRAVTKITKRDR